MKNHNKLSTLACRSLLSVIAALNSSLWESAFDIEQAAKIAVDECREKYPKLFPRELYGAAIALALSACYQKAVKDSVINARSFLCSYSQHKWNQYINGDKGAFGDLLEILVRVALLSSFRLVRPDMLHIADCMRADVISKKYGRVEIGHNGKTLSFGTFDDYMAGPYDAIIYGMFSDEDKDDIIRLCASEQIEKALDFVRGYTCLWVNKYTFQQDMNNLSRGAGITLKGTDIQIVYNPSKYKAFQQAIENGVFIPLADGVNG